MWWTKQILSAIGPRRTYLNSWTLNWKLTANISSLKSKRCGPRSNPFCKDIHIFSLATQKKVSYACIITYTRTLLATQRKCLPLCVYHWLTWLIAFLPTPRTTSTASRPPQVSSPTPITTPRREGLTLLPSSWKSLERDYLTLTLRTW